MCGICGIYGADDTNLILNMMAVLKHRGPDGCAYYADAAVTLGHTRLSINDLSKNGSQPICNEEEDLWLSINGEIYNFKELRSSLEKNGHHFKSNSDSEVVLHCYEEHGLSFLHCLRGMYALALYDQSHKRLILARDPIGKKPLYYTTTKNGEVIFASEIKAILKYPFKKEINWAGVCSYLAFGYSIGENTLFKGIKKVKAGNMLILENGKLETKTYWDLREDIVHKSENEIAEGLKSVLKTATCLRMRADVGIGVFLSGGVDSTAVASFASQFAEDVLHTFSAGFEHYSELNYANTVAEHLDTAHHELMITGRDVEKELLNIAWYFDEPMGDAAVIPTYLLSKLASKYVKVVIAGDGGDELFAGYPYYKMGLKVSPLFRIPSPVRALGKVLLDAIPNAGDVYSSSNELYRYASYLLRPTFETAHLYTFRQMADAEFDYYTNLNCHKVDSYAITPPKMKETLNKMLAIDCKNLLPEKWLMKADGGTMACSIEERLPLLDKEVINYAFSIPSNLKIHKNKEKYILKKAVADMVPKEILTRKKMGFGPPAELWVFESLRDEVNQKIIEGQIVNKIFDKQKLHKLLQNFNSKGHRSYHSGYFMWMLFALELWHNAHFN
jgi:asparagine synthase (glutamine-hydrolysing)